MGIGKKILKYIREETPTRKQIFKKFKINGKQLDETLVRMASYNNSIVYSKWHYAYAKTFKKEEEIIYINDGNLSPVELYISDTHTSCKGCNYKLIKQVIDYAYDKGVRTVFHSGDMVDGSHVYRGQIHELEDLTFEQQIQKFVNILPKKKGLEYYLINGNHDLSWMKKDAGNVGKELERRRSDIKFLGDGYGRMVKNNIKIDLVHLAGGNCYAKSYKLQIYLREFLQGKIDDRPHILSGGHLHQLLYFNYYGIHSLMPGHFQNPSEFTKRKGLMGTQGGVIVSYDIDKKKVNNFSTQVLTD